jgi:hypothetical protein
MCRIPKTFQKLPITEARNGHNFLKSTTPDTQTFRYAKFFTLEEIDHHNRQFEYVYIFDVKIPVPYVRYGPMHTIENRHYYKASDVVVEINQPKTWSAE